MSRGHRHRRETARFRLPSVSVAAMAGRARGDAGPLALTALVVALAAFLAVVTPRLVASTGDDALRWAVRAAGADADLTFQRAIDENPYGARDLQADLAETLRTQARAAQGVLPPVLDAVVQAPVTSVATLPLVVLERRGEDAAPVLRTAFVDHDGPLAVTWVAGGPAGPTLTAREARGWEDGRPVPVEVGLSEAVAAALDVGVGDVLATGNESQTVAVEARVSGVFRADDPDDRAWSAVPGLLEPRVVGSSVTRQTQLAGLLSDASLPAAVFAMPPSTTQRVVAFPPRTAALGQADVAPVLAEVAGLRAAADAPVPGGTRTSVVTTLDAVLLDARDRYGAAVAQTSVLLAGVLGVTLLTLLVAAALLVRRRATTLATHRARGATLPGIATELGTESAIVAVLGAAVGVGAAGLVATGPVPWGWLLPVVVVAAAGSPALGVRHAAGSAGGRRVAANRSERTAALRDRHAARVATEVAVVLLAVGALAALQARGVTDDAAGGPGTSGADPLLALAPTVAVLAGAALLLRVLPALLRRGVAVASRSRRAAPVLAAARAHDGARDGLAFVALTLAAGLVALGTTVVATVQRGEVDASWSAVGADATLESSPDRGLDDLAAALRDRGGVEHAVTGRVEDHTQVFGPWGGQLVRVVALPAEAYAALLADTPLPDAPALTALGTDDRGRPTALLSAGLRTDRDADVELVWETGRVDLAVVGTAPESLLGGDGTGRDDTVVVDADALATALGRPVVPDRLWVVGPGAEAAVAATAGLDGGDVATRSAWLAEHRAEPLTVGVQRLAAAATATLLVLAALVVVLAAATSAPARGLTLATLRTLGLGGRDARLVTAGELLPGTLLAAVGGAVLGALVTVVVVGPLALRLVTGQPTDPVPVWSAWAAAPVAVVAVTTVVLVVAESSLRRRERLGEVLRVGGTR